MRVILIASTLCVVAPFISGADETNEAPAQFSITNLAQVAACLERMQANIDAVNKLEDEARAAGHVNRLDCIRESGAKIASLLGMTQSTYEYMREFEKETDDEDRATEYNEITIACQRADKLAADAAACLADRPRKKKRTATDEELLGKHAPPSLPPAALLPERAERSRLTCLHQETLACLLAQAMDLVIDKKPARERQSGCSAELAKLTIEPLTGWHDGNCATLDDLAVSVARALNLRVERPDDPASYVQSLREHGLAVDTLLPERPPEGPPPLLLEAEVRAFFAYGLAAPLPSSKKILPN